MLNESKQFDRLIGRMKRQLASGGMTYAEAVVVDDMISILENVRSRAIDDAARPHRGSPRGGRAV